MAHKHTSTIATGRTIIRAWEHTHPEAHAMVPVASSDTITASKAIPTSTGDTESVGDVA